MPVAQAVLDALLIGFSRRDPLALNEFPRLASPMVQGLASRFGGGLPRDLVEEVAQEVAVALLAGRAARFEASRGCATRYLVGVTRNAIQRVRRSYGMRSLRKPKNPQKPGYTPPVSLDQVLSESPGEEPGKDYRSELEARHNVWDLVRHASPELHSTIQQMHEEGRSISEVAGMLGVSRFKLRRDLDAFLADHLPRYRTSCVPAGTGVEPMGSIRP